MNIAIYTTMAAMNEAGATLAAEKLNAAIERRGEARLILSTGASQFGLLDALVKKNVDWGKVTVFHLDEYVGLSESHPASFRKYLKERFAVGHKKFYYVNGEGDVEKEIAALTEAIREKPVDVGIIGIGENAHIAFNDPPADFKTTAAYHVVELDEKCKLQQVGEGWFDTPADVPSQAISMTPYQIMLSECIISFVPDERKANAILQTVSSSEPVPEVPASIFKTHKDSHLLLDSGSASLLDAALRKDYNITVHE